jgi:hypothetical protein
MEAAPHVAHTSPTAPDSMPVTLATPTIEDTGAVS